jgi:hypothetical protein
MLHFIPNWQPAEKINQIQWFFFQSKSIENKTEVIKEKMTAGFFPQLAA